MVGWVGRQRGNAIYAGLLVKKLMFDGQDTVTAHSGGGKANAFPLKYGLNRITVAAAAADSVLMPFATPGAVVFIIQDASSANSVTVFGQGTDTIDGVATATGNPMAAAKRAVFTCETAGAWQSFAGAKIT